MSIPLLHHPRVYLTTPWWSAYGKLLRCIYNFRIRPFGLWCAKAIAVEYRVAIWHLIESFVCQRPCQVNEISLKVGTKCRGGTASFAQRIAVRLVHFMLP